MAGAPAVVAVAPDAVPVQASANEALTLAPGPGGVLSIALPSGSDTVVVSFDRTGAIRPGWPVRVTAGCELAATPESSVWLACVARDQGLWAIRLQPDGRLAPGFPVVVADPTAGCSPNGAVARDGVLLMLCEDGSSGVRTASVDGAGSVTMGTPVELSGTEGPNHLLVGWSLAADGTAFALVLDLPSGDLPAAATHLTAIDLRGTRVGWPIDVAGQASQPTVASDGLAYVIAGANRQPSSRVLAFDRSGRQVLQSAVLGAEATSDWNGAGAPVLLAPPVVASDGTAFLVSSDSSTTVYGVERSTGAIRQGWPYRATLPVAWTGYCGQTTGCGGSRAAPATGSDGTLYLSLAGSADRGGDLVAIGPDGRARTGWPVHLARPGAAFWTVGVGPDATVFALAVEPEANDHRSATIVAFDPAGEVLYRRTVLEP